MLSTVSNWLAYMITRWDQQFPDHPQYMQVIDYRKHYIIMCMLSTTTSVASYIRS